MLCCTLDNPGGEMLSVSCSHKSSWKRETISVEDKWNNGQSKTDSQVLTDRSYIFFRAQYKDLMGWGERIVGLEMTLGICVSVALC